MSQERKSQEQVIVANSGEPFKTENAARAAMANKNLDAVVWHVEQRNDGWIIASMTPPQGAVDTKEKFWHMKFHHKSDVMQETDIVLGVQGDVIVIKRGAEIVLPDRFREAADHTKYPKYEQDAGKPRKIVAWVHLFPYDILGEGTEAEYLTMRRNGTIKTRQAIEANSGVAEP